MTPGARTPHGEETTRLLAPLADLASRAGARILQFAADDLAARIKQDRSPVTAADVAAEAILSDGLERILPGVPIVAEEASAREPPRAAAAYWLVDPIDGTRELLAGRNEYAVNIALIADHAPVLGLLYAPALETLYVGVAGRALKAELAPGARYDDTRANPIRTRPRPERLVALVSRSHKDAAGDEYLARLPVARKIPLGSSLKFARLAEGGADVYVRLATINEWDVAAGHAVLAAAGGAVTAPDGGALRYGLPRSGMTVRGFLAWGEPPG
jgi:3'(2'), 5'-bisphosphate nucleotidase